MKYIEFEEKGKIVSRRVLSVEPEVQIEYVIFLNGIINGILSVTDSGTLVSTLRRGTNGIYYSQGKGIVSMTYGTEMSTWMSQGIQNDTNKKNLLRGSAFYTSTSTGKLAFLNNTMTVFKSETDEDGNDQDCIRLVNSLLRRSVCSSNNSSSKSCRLPSIFNSLWNRSVTNVSRILCNKKPGSSSVT